MTEQSKKPTQRRSGGMPGHLRAESSVTISGIRTADLNRRVWLVIDELPSLHKPPSLPEFLAESRKSGGCGAIGFQDITQLRERWSDNGAIALTGQCATWDVLRENDPETAKWAANSFGQIEFLEANQGLSYGANDMRDGMSLTQSRKTQPLLLDSQILNLNDLEGYIRLPGSLPVASGCPRSFAQFDSSGRGTTRASPSDARRVSRADATRAS